MPPSNPLKEFALLVESEARHAESVRSAMRDLPLELVIAEDVRGALEHLERVTPRLVLSELALPDGSGFALCRHLRRSPAPSDVPIMLISRWCSENDRILAFECGADDFLAKPFFERELSSRVRALLRRSEPTALADRPPSLEAGSLPIEIDEERHEVRFDETPVILTPLEFSLIATLARHRGRVLSRGDLISEAWQTGESPTERSVDAHVKSLRRKLGDAKDVIETVRGLGYRYSDRALRAQPTSKAASGLD